MDIENEIIETAFFGFPLRHARGAVMAPRRATEALVSAAVNRVGDGSARVADVGTGSGAIAIAIALSAPGAQLWASEVDARAAAFARENVRRYGLEERVHVAHADLLEAAPGELDLVVANLPYLPDRLRNEARYRQEYAGDPPGAVFSAGDGLGLYRRLIDQASERLTREGTLLIQLHRRVLVAAVAELNELRARLDDPVLAAA